MGEPTADYEPSGERADSAHKDGRVLGSDAARAVDRFNPSGPAGYRAATMPDAPLRATRLEAVADERAWLDRHRAAACG